MYNEASKRATIRYQQAHLAQINLKVPKADKERYIQAAEQAGMPLAAFIKDAIEEKMPEHKSSGIFWDCDIATRLQGFKP